MDSSVVGMLLKMVTALGAVLLVFAACVWFFRKAQAKFGDPEKARKLWEVGLALAPKSKVADELRRALGPGRPAR